MEMVLLEYCTARAAQIGLQILSLPPILSISVAQTTQTTLLPLLQSPLRSRGTERLHYIILKDSKDSAALVVALFSS